ncbi:MAG: sugar transferase [Armatimonadetes bacterium]|nr:sugar transferase [Armatimonadota bacterium]
MRLFDLALAFLLLVPFLPVFAFVAFLNSITGNDIAFVQRRIGRSGSLISVFKFATMRPDAHIIGGTITVRDDPRVTPLGRILRKYKINETLQLLNILRGDMSFVGPRPLAPSEVATYPPAVRDVIYSQRPGLTGWASLVFHAEEDILSVSESQAREWYQMHISRKKSALELWYVGNRSLGLQIQVIFKTIAGFSLGFLQHERTWRAIHGWMLNRMGPSYAWMFQE